MDKQGQDAESTSGGAGTSAAGRNKNRQYDENFIPLDLGDDFDDQQVGMLVEDEDVVMSDQEMEEDEEDEEDVSSDGVETDGEDDDDEGEGEGEEELGEDLVKYGDDEEEEMNEEDEYNMYQEQLRYEDDDDY